MMIHAGGAPSATFTDGLDTVVVLVSDYFTTVDPILLRSAAACLESKATTSYELGVACGIRIHAAELQDRLDALTDRLPAYASEASAVRHDLGDGWGDAR